jgi:hypothetical protein
MSQENVEISYDAIAALNRDGIEGSWRTAIRTSNGSRPRA